jgi:hypothetical protein
MVLVPWVVVTYSTTAHDTGRGIRGNSNRSVAPDPADTIVDGPTFITDATDAIETSPRSRWAKIGHQGHELHPKRSKETSIF